MPNRQPRSAETRAKISKSLTGRKLSAETRAKIGQARPDPSPDSLKAVPTRLRPDQIEDLALIQGDRSLAIRTAVDLLLEMIKIREYTPEQTNAIAEYEQIAAEFPVGVIFIFNPKTLGGVFYNGGVPTAIANPTELAEAWNNSKPKPKAKPKATRKKTKG